MTMSDVQAPDASREIYVAVAVYVFEPGVLGLGYVDRGSMREAARNGFVSAL
jgi:hypothetical protein